MPSRSWPLQKPLHYDVLNEKLESHYKEWYLHRLAENRHRQTEDIEKFLGINDRNGHLFKGRNEELKRFRENENLSGKASSSIRFWGSYTHSLPHNHHGVKSIGSDKDGTKQGDCSRGPTSRFMEVEVWYPVECFWKFVNQVAAKRN